MEPLLDITSHNSLSLRVLDILTESDSNQPRIDRQEKLRRVIDEMQIQLKNNTLEFKNLQEKIDNGY